MIPRLLTSSSRPVILIARSNCIINAPPPSRFISARRYVYPRQPESISNSSAPGSSSVAKMAEEQNKKPAWYESLPQPKSKPGEVEASEVLKWMEDGSKTAGKDFVLVDVRRNDHEGGTIAGSLNLPAQSFIDIRGTLYELLSGAGVKSVAFYCGSCGGRGPRVAGWFKDYVEERKDGNVDVLYLKGGIKGWVANGDKYTTKMSSFDPQAWKRASDCSRATQYYNKILELPGEHTNLETPIPLEHIYDFVSLEPRDIIGEGFAFKTSLSSIVVL